MEKCESSFTLHTNRSNLDVSDSNLLESWKASPILNCTDAKDRQQVQRSVSLRLDSRPLSRAWSGGKDQRDVRDINGNFELSHLLARASSLDVKLMQELQDDGHHSSEPLPDWPSFMCLRQKRRKPSLEHSTNSESQSRHDDESSRNGDDDSEGFGHVDKVSLPLRYRHMIQRRRAGRVPPASSPPSGGGSGSLSNVHKLGSLPETEDDLLAVQVVEEDGSPGQPMRNRCGSDVSLSVRQRDAKLAMMWAHQEIRGLKQQNRTLLRQLLELGAAIHRIGMDSSHSVSGNLGLRESISTEDYDIDNFQDSLTTSMVAINTQTSTPRKIGPLSFNSIDHFFCRD